MELQKVSEALKAKVDNLELQKVSEALRSKVVKSAWQGNMGQKKKKKKLTRMEGILAI